MSMEKKQKMSVEIADLLEEAVNNATARRNLGLDGQESPSELSEEHIQAIKGGQKPIPMQTMGIVMGLFPTDTNIA